jgi:hypothetical protein
MVEILNLEIYGHLAAAPEDNTTVRVKQEVLTVAPEAVVL